MTSAFDTALLLRLRVKLTAALDDSGRTLLDGTLKNFEDYKRHVGYRNGIERAVDILAEVEKELSSPPLKRNTP